MGLRQGCTKCDPDTGPCAAPAGVQDATIICGLQGALNINLNTIVVQTFKY